MKSLMWYGAKKVKMTDDWKPKRARRKPGVFSTFEYGLEYYNRDDKEQEDNYVTLIISHGK